jgi:hypothetical protein
MSINHQNIEVFLLDYLEGNLDPLLTAELMAFLAENPEYEEFIAGQPLHGLSSSGEHFPDAFLLKKDFKDIPEISDANFDEFCIAASEGLLNPSDMERLNLFVGEDSLKIKNLELFKSLKLKADLSVGFPNKSKLKKNRGLIFPAKYLYSGFAIAASIAVIILLFLNKPEVGTNPASDITSTEDKPLPAPTVINPVANTEHPTQDKTVPSLPSSDRVIVSENIDNPDIEPVSGSPDEPVVLLTTLEPVSGKIPTSLNDSPLYPDIWDTKNTNRVIKPERRIRIESENLFAELFSRINFWKTAESAISGFNYLTEANLSIGKALDDDGRLSRLTLNTESYTIEGKLK